MPALRRRRAGVAEARTGDRRFLFAIVVVSVAMAFGLPGLFDAVGLVPVLGQTNNTRLIVVYLFALALLAGYGLDDLRGPASRNVRRLALAVALVTFAVPVVYVLATWPPPGTLLKGAKLALGPVDPSAEIDVVHSRRSSGGVSSGSSAARCWPPGPGARGGRHLRGAGAGPGLRGPLPGRGGLQPRDSADEASLPSTPAIRFLQSQRPARFVAFDRGLAPNHAMRYGLYDARNYDFPIEKRYDVIWRRYVFPVPVPAGRSAVGAHGDPPALRVLGLLGVRDVMVPPDEAAYARRIGISTPPWAVGLPVAYDRPDGRIYRNPRALPRAFVVHAQRVVDGPDAALDAVGNPSGPDLGRVAVSEHRLPGLADDSTGAPARSPARIVSYGPRRVVIDARSRRAGLAVLSDVSYPGWKATVNGREVPIHRVDYLIRGVSVPAGRSRVVFTYEPESARAGVLLSGGSLIALAAAAVFLLFGRRRRAGDGDG